MMTTAHITCPRRYGSLGNTSKLGWAVAACCIAMCAGCEAEKKEDVLDQQINQRVGPVEQRLKEQESSSRAAQSQLQQRISALESAVSEQRGRIQDLAMRMQAAEAALAGYAQYDFAALVDSTEAMQGDLRKLRGDLTGHTYTAEKQFEDFQLIHANFEQADEDMRKLVASSVTGLERRSEQARQESYNKMVGQFEQDRSIVTSAFRDLERQVEAGRARTALAMQLLSEFLEEEHQAIAAHATRLEAVQDRMERQFAPQASGEHDREANRLFDRARESHRKYAAENFRSEYLDEAIVAYSKGLALRPDAVEMHYELGKLLHESDRADEAKPHLLYYLKSGQDAEKRRQVENWIEAN